MRLNTPLRTESEIADLFADFLRSGTTVFGPLEVATVPRHGESASGIVARDARDRLIAFEASLRDWKKALLLAYRDTLFAHRAYIVLPAHAALHALRYRREFELRGIGLCSVAKSGIQVEIEAGEHSPAPA
ncbi:MAG TPA: hypothetical protein VK996_16475 [Ramlibacter sp.]|nr:hypothetical protein [Ramlibacter sp.]